METNLAHKSCLNEIIDRDAKVFRLKVQCDWEAGMVASLSFVRHMSLTAPMHLIEAKIASPESHRPKDHLPGSD